MSKELSKEETAEQAADKYCLKYDFVERNNGIVGESFEDIFNAFIAGTKWSNQQTAAKDKEIERLKELLMQYYIGYTESYGYSKKDAEVKWRQFETENNL